VKAFQAPAPHITRADRPAAELAADIKAIVARQRNCQTLADAAAHTHSPSDRIAYAHDAWLLSHPDACACTDDYPGFAEYVAARETANRKAELALKEAL
jgi:hypothetical protein